MTDPDDDAHPDDDATAADRPSTVTSPSGEPDEPVPVEPVAATDPPAEPVPEAQREAEQTIRSISRLEERN